MAEDAGYPVAAIEPLRDLTAFAVGLRYIAGSQSDRAALDHAAEISDALASLVLAELPLHGLSLPGTLPFPVGADPTVVMDDEDCPCDSGLPFRSCHYEVFRVSGILEP